MRHIIIGAGAAGIQAAKTIRANQPDAAIGHDLHGLLCALSLYASSLFKPRKR